MHGDIQQFLSWCQQRSHNQLTELLASHSIPSAPLRNALGYSLLAGGKRIRPALVYAAAAACGEIQATTDRFACAVEAIHCYSLIHDDLPAMDDDDLRRGQPTNHKVHGEAMAILAGDLLQSLAFEWLATCSSASANTVVAAHAVLAKGAALMVSGQALDINAADKQQSIEELEIVHRNKTGALIESSLILGGLSSQASEDQLSALALFGQAIGLAFQVKDDILDVEADTATLGKQQGADAQHNKPTYVSLLGLDGAKARAANLYEEAIAALHRFDEKANTLRQLAEYIVMRHY